MCLDSLIRGPLQHATTRCNTWVCTIIRRAVYSAVDSHRALPVVVWCSVFQCVAMWQSVALGVVVTCSVCSVLQCVAVCCSQIRFKHIASSATVPLLVDDVQFFSKLWKPKKGFTTGPANLDCCLFCTREVMVRSRPDWYIWVFSGMLSLNIRVLSLNTVQMDLEHWHVWESFELR